MIHTATQKPLIENPIIPVTLPLYLYAHIFSKIWKLSIRTYEKTHGILRNNPTPGDKPRTSAHSPAEKKTYKTPIEITAKTAAPSNTFYI